VAVTPKGVEYLLQHESPVRALEDLRETIDAQRLGVPIWVAELRKALEGLQRRLASEIEGISQRLDRLSERALEAIQRLEQARGPDVSALPWAPQALSYLEERQTAELGATCPLAELFTALHEREVILSLRDFHLGLRRLHDRGLVRLLPDDGQGQPPAPEYGLLDDNMVYHHVMRVEAAA
jgi:hypothetical protein